MVTRFVRSSFGVAIACATAVAAAQAPVVRKPTLDDTIRANVYADNSFVLYVNGELVAVATTPVEVRYSTSAGRLVTPPKSTVS